MRKLFFVFAAIMIFFQITATTRDDSRSIIEEAKTFLKKKIEIANENLKRFNPIISGVKRAIKARPETPESIAILIDNTSLVTKALLYLMPGAIAEGLGIPSLAVCFIPYVTIANPNNIVASIIDQKNDNRYTISNITLQNSVINSYGD